MTLLLKLSQCMLRAALVTGLAGCSALLAPPQRPAEPVAPASWHDGSAPLSAAPASSGADPWWLGLHDPQLDALQSRALATNLDTLRKALSLERALAQVRLGTLEQQPHASLSVNTNANRTLRPGDTSVVINGVSVPVDTAARTHRSYGINAGLAYELDLWSKLSAATQGERAHAESRREEWRYARWLASAKVAEAYWTIAAIEAKLPMLTELSQAADEALGIASIRMKEGKLRADEVDVVVTRQFEARKRMADAQAERSRKQNELMLLLDSETLALAPGAARLPSAEPPQLALGTPAQTLERRADVRQARLAVDAALARLHVAEASRYPSLSMNSGLTSNGETWRNWFSQPLASLGLSLAVPMVDWRRLGVQRDLARNELDDAALALRASVRQALVEVEDALVERERWQQAWQAAQMQQVEKARLHAVARLRQDVGVFSRLDVLQSREGLLMAQLDIIDLRLKAWLNRLALQQALGGTV